MTRCNATTSQDRSADIIPIGGMNSENLCHRPLSDVRRGRGGDATTSQGEWPEAVVRWQVVALADRRRQRDKIALPHKREGQCNNISEKVKRGKTKVRGKIISFSFK